MGLGDPGPQGIGYVAIIVGLAAMVATAFLTMSIGWTLAAGLGGFVLAWVAVMVLATVNARRDRR